MLAHVDDTIVALASAAGGALRGVVRVSGPGAPYCVARYFTPDEPGLPLANIRQATVVSGQFDLGDPLHAVPCELYLWPTSRSYTRQPSAELHMIGSPPVLDAALDRLCAAGARLAQPGEFTLRAFLAGRLDLTQAEAVLGVIDAQSGTQLQTALDQLAGGLAAPLNRLRDELLNLLAHLEAGLDFVEEDIEFITQGELDAQLTEIQRQVDALVSQVKGRSEAEGAARVVLRGLPNVGKSSLLNALAGDMAALVSDEPGTTRDYLVRPVKWHDTVCLLIDTAGFELQPASGSQAVGPSTALDADVVSPAAIKAAAQRLGNAQQQQAHLQLLCIDASRPPTQWELGESLTAGTQQLVVWTKVDRAILPLERLPGIKTSSASGEGLNELRGAIADRLAAQSHDGCVASTAVRCRESLRLAAESLTRTREALHSGWGEELIAAELRGALDELGKVVGAVYTDDVLDRVFSRFCIGK